MLQRKFEKINLHFIAGIEKNIQQISTSRGATDNNNNNNNNNIGGSPNRKKE